MGGTLVVAGLWVRPLAESARAGGWQVIAMDLFGDADTRRASLQWHAIGRPEAFAIEPALLRAALRRAAEEPGLVGWVAGSGFESLPEALDWDIAELPRLGMGASAVRRVRDPVCFFGMLDRLGLDHPPVSLAPPAHPQGWIAKSAAGSGGWHIRAAGGAPAPGAYYQRIQPGQPMSALFVADGTRARLVALNQLLVRPLGSLPYVYAGAIGPIRDDALARRLELALAALVPAFGLRGLASLDFIAQDGRAWLLEVNARPSATMVLHDRAWAGGLVRAHVRAARGELPAAAPSHPPGLRGHSVVFARAPCRVDAALAAELAQAPDCHDLPAAGARFAEGEPVCSVSAEGPSVEAVRAALEEREEHLQQRLCEELAA